LLVALLIFIIGVPIANDLNVISPQVSRIVGMSCLLAVGIWSLRGTGWLFSVAMSVVIGGIVLSGLSIARENDTLYVISLLALFVFLSLATFNAFRQVAVGNDISPNRIIGAICVYLMLGVIWSVAYYLLEFSQPGSFKGLSEMAPPALVPDWIYFSFVTITTLGYGDITPVTLTARSLSFAEAIVGQFYIAVLVAGLVSAYISAKQNSSNGD
jgi:hypothetical protein